MTIVDEIRQRGVEQPSHPALVCDDRVVSYGELVGSFDARAKQLTAEGVTTGERCGLVAPQGAEYVEAALGILAAGACFVPISEDHRGRALEAFAARAHLHHCLAVDAGSSRLRAFPGAAPVDGQGDEAFRALGPAYLRFTSGTTSERKGVILGHETILERLAAANETLEIGPGDRVLWLLPMAHHFVVSILLYLRQGATILLPAGSLAQAVLDCASRGGATVFYASPYHYKLLAKDASERRLDGVRLAVSTAEGLRESIARDFAARYGFPLVQALGIIEVGLPVVNTRSAAAKPCALGRPLPAYDVWLRGEDGRPVTGRGEDASGEICIRGPGLLDAYMEPWLPAAELLEPDGFRTGDQGFFDADGDLHLVGRRATRICMAGMKFFGEEVEAVLDTHPGVRRSRVFGRPHEHLGEIPVAELVPEGDAAPERRELVAFLREQLPAYKIPRAFEVVEALPLTDTGKLRRRDRD